jgi:hypothetical protein
MMMLEQAGNPPPNGHDSRLAVEPLRIRYEPPKITALGTFHELTQQQLKVSGSADFMSFQPSHV